MAILFVVVVLVAGYIGISRPGINGTASGDRWNSENNVSSIKRRGYLRIAVLVICRHMAGLIHKVSVLVMTCV